MKQPIEQFIADVEKRNQHEPEFMQAVREVAESVFHTSFRMTSIMVKTY